MMGQTADRYESFVRSREYREERPEKARVIAHLCRNELEGAGRIVDLGTGTGIIKNELEVMFDKSIAGFDLDRSFMEASPRMAVADVLHLPLSDRSVDFAVANHLYEHVSDQAALFREVARVLAPGGSAYVSAGNRLMVMEPHYRLPFLSWLPRGLAAAYVRASGRGGGYDGIRFLTWGRLAALLRGAGLEVEDRTERALDDLLGERRGAGARAAWRALRALPAGLRRVLLRWLSPQWFLVLRRREAA
ncbi:MAG: class I SAM-dependent methyltransferase [Candidatus Palauibacterales bacterium]|nr:class I SAM-dependent methyltransferase [Candidatus Palauibacterales bacterium]MDP2529380.1 class I SAM-dependent methyltransferase [Candidatus Palauibacterales bacterium]MDP2583213.1 class I SAM-dependent methyltransferase [Candidatus Palauibacterales bacterium]